MRHHSSPFLAQLQLRRIRSFLHVRIPFFILNPCDNSASDTARADTTEFINAANNFSYFPEGVATGVFGEQEGVSMPLFRLNNVVLQDHFYTFVPPSVAPVITAYAHMSLYTG